MGDENTKDGAEAGTSRDDQEGSAHNMREDRNQDDRESYTNSTESTGYTGRGRVENVAERRANTLKSPVLKKVKGAERKQRRKPSGGRVVKRSRSQARRKLRKAPKRKAKPQNQRQYRAPSVSTIFTRRTSMSGSTRTDSGARGCEYCGHRCCRRRFEDELRRHQRRPRVNRQPRKVTVTEAVQAGSRSAMLSPLFINATSTADDMVEEPSKSYSDVTPQMIYESLKRLTMMKQNVPLGPIIGDMKRYFPVNPDEQELSNEIFEKLQVATIVGFVLLAEYRGEEAWCLNYGVKERKLAKNHVTRFWKIYADTMKPINRTEAPADTNIKNKNQAEGTDTNDKSRRNGVPPRYYSEHYI